jgi:hypothetical protein
MAGSDDDDDDPPDSPQYASNVVHVTENVASAATWEAGKVYYIDSGITVSNGATLTVQAGAIVKFGPDGTLEIDNGGTIKARGTAAAKIYFTSIRDAAVGGDSITNDGSTAPGKGDWQYAWTRFGSTGNEFSYCVFRYAGKDNQAALCLDGAAAVDHCEFYSNLCGLPYNDSVSEEAALDARSAESGTTITNNLFYGNAWPLAVPATMSLDASNTFSYDHDNNPETDALTNTHQGIYLYYADQITAATAWSEDEVPLCVFDDEIVVETTGTLTIGSGVVCKFTGASAGISAYGTLNRTGAVFTSYRDDSHLGDTNADGSASGPSDGDWVGIWIDGTEEGEYLATDSDSQILYAAYPEFF